MVLLPDPFGPARTRSLGCALCVDRDKGGCVAGLLPAGLLDTLEDCAGLYAFAHRELLENN